MLETVTVGVLALLVILAVGGLLMELPSVVRPPFLGGEHLGNVLDHVLALFILVELLATAVAFVRGTDILRRIFEAVLVALGRKLITSDLSKDPLEQAGALSVLLVSVALAWWIVW